jgi:aryl-alcohol dehydrogenase-like predicted oxidoreductase
MERRNFLKATALGAATVVLDGGPAQAAKQAAKAPAMPKRTFGKDGPKLSIIGFPGLVLRRVDQQQSDRLVAEAVERGVNYFDVAPAYGDAEIKLGPSLAPYRKEVFLACKTKRRDRDGVKAEFERSLERLRTDHFDLYQLHHLQVADSDMKPAFAKGGAMEYLQEQRKAGRIRYLGFSAHTEEAALAAMERFGFDSVMFPISFASWLKAGFGPKVVRRARELGVTVLAIKALCRQRWTRGDPLQRKYRMWYQPVHDRAEAELALRFTLSQGVTAALPPSHVDVHKLALDLAPTVRPIAAAEVARLKALAQTLNPLFPYRPRSA